MTLDEFNNLRVGDIVTKQGYFTKVKITEIDTKTNIISTEVIETMRGEPEKGLKCDFYRADFIGFEIFKKRDFNKIP